MLNFKLNEVWVIICHSVSQYYPLITLFSHCLFASYLFKTAVYHSQPDWFIIYFQKKAKMIFLGPRLFFLLFDPLVDEKAGNWHKPPQAFASSRLKMALK